MTTDLINQACPEEKDAAAVKAEREAKKLAKAAAKQAAKSKEKSNNQPEAIDTSAPEGKFKVETAHPWSCPQPLSIKSDHVHAQT